MKAVARVVALCCCVALVSTQVPGWWLCPNAQPQATLDLIQYLGQWYEIYKFPARFEEGQNCITAEYTMKEDGHIKVTNRGYIDGVYQEAVGDGYVPDENSPAKLKVRFSEEAPYGNYWVLETDYENYSLVFSCESILGPFAHVEFAWILSRSPELDQTTADRLIEKLRSAGVNTDVFQKTDQSNCPGRR